jgi:hypothetical protein
MHIADKYGSQMRVEFYQIAGSGKITDKSTMGGVDQSVDLCNVLCLDGGPTGCTAAALSADEGTYVVMLKKATHRRFQIGESLLPSNRAGALFGRSGISFSGLLRDIRRPKWITTIQIRSLPVPDVYRVIHLTGVSPSLIISIALGLFAALFSFIFLPCLSTIRRCAVIRRLKFEPGFRHRSPRNQ